MPIAVRVVSDQEFAAWVEAAKKKFATQPGELVRRGGRDSRAVSRRLNRPGQRNDRTRATGPTGSERDCKAGFDNGNSDTGSRRSRPRA